MADITMPQLGETVTEGTITKWFKSVGDEISEDEPLFEVSTDKVDSEVPSPESGYLAEILVEEGDTVDVGTKLAVISDEAPSGNGQKSEKAEEEAKDEEKASEAEDEEDEEDEEQQEEDEAAEDVPEDDDEDEGETPDEEARPANAEAEADKAEKKEKKEEAKQSKSAESSTKTEERKESDSKADDDGKASGKVLSPVVRKLIAEHDLDPDQIEGTGQGGRITRADVLSVIDTGKSKAAPKEEEKGNEEKKAPAREDKGGEKREESPRPAAPAAKAGADDEAIAFSNIRRRTAEHMVRSKSTSAHVLTAIEVDFENVDGVRRGAQRDWKEREGFTLTYLPFISRAVIDAVEDYPHVNASVGDGELVVHRKVHLGIAVDLSFQGLLAPVVHDADGKRLRAIAREIHDLAARARAKKLSADEIQGGTFTITNPGGYGTLITAPIINQPQVAILSTDGVKKKPVAVELDDGTDAVVVHPVGILALSFDHRAFDGAYASAFIARVKEILETRDWSQEL